MSSSRKSKRRTWSRDEVALLLKCYTARKSEFQHSRKKIFGYRKVHEDMLQQGFPDPSLTVSAVEGKVKTLYFAYRTGKDSPSVSPFTNELREIFGSKSNADERCAVTGNNSTADRECDTTNWAGTITPVSFVKEENISEDNISTFSSGNEGEPTTQRRSARNPVVTNLTPQNRRLEFEENFKVRFLEQLKSSLEEHFRNEEEILREAQNKKIKLLDEFLKRMENM